MTSSDSDSLKTILSKLNPAEIEVDALGRIIVKSAEIRDALRAAAAQTRPDATQLDSPTNGHQCGCFNHTGCLPLAE